MTQWEAFAITVACELPVMLWLNRRLPAHTVALTTLVINAITHPIAWTAALLLSPENYRSGLWVIESVVVLTEAVGYALWLRNKLPRALTHSLAANAASLGIGWWLW